MQKYLIMLTLCVVTQTIYTKSIFDYNINPEYDLVAEEAKTYSQLWPSSEFAVDSHIRYKHQARRKDHGKGYGKRKPHDYDTSNEYNYPDFSAEDSDEIYHNYHHHPHHPHGGPPGKSKKYGHHHNHPQVIPPRFPPPPVYDKDFINPWRLAETTTKRFTDQEPFFTTSVNHVKPEVTTRKNIPITTSIPITSTTADDDQLTYDIDVRFGRE